MLSVLCVGEVLTLVVGARGVKAGPPFWKMHKTDALNTFRKDPFSDKYTQVTHG